MKLPEVQGIEKGLDLHIKPGRQRLVRPSMDMRPPISKPRIGQGRACIRRKAMIVLPPTNIYPRSDTIID